jgi:DNA-binding transcriptional ArsR family regulator
MTTGAPDPAVLAAIASPRRREILRLTWRGERGAGALREAMPDVSWGAVSLQIKALVDAELLHVRVDGRRRFYRARQERLGDLAPALEQMWGDALWRLKLAAELEATRRGPPPQARRPRARTTLRKHVKALDRPAPSRRRVARG